VCVCLCLSLYTHTHTQRDSLVTAQCRPLTNHVALSNILNAAVVSTERILKVPTLGMCILLNCVIKYSLEIITFYKYLVRIQKINIRFVLCFYYIYKTFLEDVLVI